MLCIILAAGFGTRLYPLTRDKPKPLLMVGRKPIIEYAIDRIENLRRYENIEKIYIVSNNRFYEHYNLWAREIPHNCNLEILNDGTNFNEERLGAIRDIDFALQKIGKLDDCLVIAGDNLITFELIDLVRFFREKKAVVIGVKDIKKPEVMSKYGAISLDADGKIIDFEEKPVMPKSTIISLGIYLFNLEVLNLIAEYLKEGNNPDAPGYFIQWLYKKVPCYGYPISSPWFDIGDIESYHKANTLYSR